MGKKINLAKNFSKFVISNVIGTIVDTVVLWLFSHFVFSSYVGQYIASPVISFVCAVTTNYLYSVFFTWKDRMKYRKMSVFIRKYFVYNASSSAVFLVKMGFLLLIEAISGWNVVWCNLMALLVSGLVNFVMGECVIFKKNKINAAADSQ